MVPVNEIVVVITGAAPIDPDAAARIPPAAIVLAAGAGSRFSDEPGTKLLATVDGEPLLAHVLEAVRAYGPTVTAVVLGHGADAIEAGIDWQGELRVKNHGPERGLASSIQVGIDTLRAYPGNLDGTFIAPLCYGDGKVTRSEFTGPAADFEAKDRNNDGIIDKADAPDAKK